MFLRKNRKSFDGQVYEYWTLCQTVRTERGPRQQVVACLGKLSDEDLHAGWEDIEALLDGRAPPPRQPQLFASALSAADECVQFIDALHGPLIERIELRFGEIHLGFFHVCQFSIRLDIQKSPPSARLAPDTLPLSQLPGMQRAIICIKPLQSTTCHEQPSS